MRSIQDIVKKHKSTLTATVLDRRRPWDVTCRLKWLCLNDSAKSERVLHNEKQIRGRLGFNWLLLTFGHFGLRSLITRCLA